MGSDKYVTIQSGIQWPTFQTLDPFRLTKSYTLRILQEIQNLRHIKSLIHTHTHTYTHIHTHKYTIFTFKILIL